jgi:hypothetical protein
MAAPVLQFKRGLLANLPGLRAGEPGFTTDSYDLYVGISSQTSTNKFFGSHRYWRKETTSTGSGVNLVEGTSNGSGYITLKAPDSLVGVGTYVLPDTNSIIDGYFLKVASDGSLSWDTAGGTNGTFTNPRFVGVTTVSETSFDVNADSDFSGITTFSNTTDNTLGDANTGAVQIDGGLGINKNVTIGAGLSVSGQSHFIGTATFYGGQINLGDSDGDNISVAGEFVSNLVPNATNTYDLGLIGKRWRNGYYSGNVDITGNLNVDGNVTIGGTAVTLLGQDVFIQNKDIILGYTTSIAPTDDTANHAGVAIASTIGSPLVSFSASGINTLPDTYKQMMWFHAGTLGFGTDAFAFNYGVAIGTTTMANGVRLAVGSGVTVGDTSVSATTFYGSVVGNVSSADQVKTVTASDNNATYHLTFVDANNGSATNETVYTDDGIYYNPGTNTFTTQHTSLTGNLNVAGITTTGTLKLSGTSGIGITGISASTTLAEDSDAYLPTQKAVKAYVDAVDLTTGIAGDTGTGTVSTSQTLTIAGTVNEIETSASNQTITVGLPNAVVVGTSLSSPTVRANIIQSQNTGETAITIVDNDVTVADDLTVQGNLYVNGNTTQVNTSSLTVEDRTIQLGIVNGASPTSATTWDLGVLFNYYTNSAKQSAVVWEHGDSRFKFGSAISDDGGTDVNGPQITVSTFAPIEIGSLWVTDCAGTTQVISCTDSTRYLENITIDAGTF